MRRISGWVGLLLLAGTAVAETVPWDEWLLPNFSGRLTVQVHNPAAVRVKGLATIPVAAAAAVAPNFPGSLAIAMMQASVLASQADDLDGDGTPDQFHVAIDLG